MSSPVTLTDFKAYLNLTSNSGPGGDTELQGFLDAATDLLSFRVGAINSTAGIVEPCNGGSSFIVLKAPIVSVTSVVEWIGTTSYTLTEQEYANGGPFSQYGYSIDGPKTLTRKVSGFTGRFASGRYNVVVTYTGGFATCPPSMLLAIKELGKHLFKTQSGSRGGGAVDWNKSMAFSLPNRVVELIAPWDDAGVGMFA